MRGKNIAYTLTFIAAGIIIGFVLTGTFRHQTLTLAEKDPLSISSTELLDRFSNSLSEVASVTTPSIVSISSTQTVEMRDSGLNDLFNDPFFHQFFGDQFRGHEHPRKFQQSSLGSGVIVSADGYILTNNHVVQNADKLVVTLATGDQSDGKVIGTDPKSDLALVKIDKDNLTPLKLGDSETLKAGDIVLAVGIPFGLSHTVTMGIVSAVGRSNVGIAEYEDFIQTDAAINPGNSGGALVNTRGELVGINTAIFSTSGGYMGVGFAIPANMAKTVMQSLIKFGKVIRGWLGVNIQNITPELAKHFSLEQHQGALIADIGKNTPASKADLQRGDIIISMNGKEVKDATALKNMVASTSPGTKVMLGIIRQGEKKEVAVTLGEFPEKETPAAASVAKGVFDGVHVVNPTGMIRERYNIPEDITGVVVDQIDPQSEAAGILKQGDVIQQINHQDIGSVKDFLDITEKLPKDTSLLLLIYRNGVHLFITIGG
jgi:serine protease Do